MPPLILSVPAAPAAPAEGTEDDKQESDTKGLRRTQRKRAPPPPPFSTPSSIEGKKSGVHVYCFVLYFLMVSSVPIYQISLPGSSR